MSGRVDELRESRGSYSRAWSEFLMFSSRHSGAVFCFFEGVTDVSYYYPRISAILGSCFGTTDCKGKESVLKCLTLYRESGRHEEIALFFVDNDYWGCEERKAVKDENLYVTPCYSVENLYVGPDVMKQLLRAEFYLGFSDRDTLEFESLCRTYDDLLKEFCEKSLELNAWLAEQKIRSCKSGKTMCFSIKMQDLFRVSLDGVERLYTIELLNENHGDLPAITESDLLKWKGLFGTGALFMQLRGKFLFWFFEIVLRRLVDDSREKKNRRFFSAKRGVRLQLSGNILSELSQYALTPSCLTRFLSKFS